MHLRQVLNLALGACFLAACGGGDEDDAAGATISCRVESAGNAVQCLEYTVPHDAVAATRDGCTAGGGTLVASCAKENRLGTCTTHIGSTLTLVTHYYAGGLTTDTAQELCSGNGGSWAPG
jgi:hypothetical protein